MFAHHGQSTMQWMFNDFPTKAFISMGFWDFWLKTHLFTIFHRIFPTKTFISIGFPTAYLWFPEALHTCLQDLQTLAAKNRLCHPFGHAVVLCCPMCVIPLSHSLAMDVFICYPLMNNSPSNPYLPGSILIYRNITCTIPFWEILGIAYPYILVSNTPPGQKDAAPLFYIYIPISRWWDYVKPH